MLKNSPLLAIIGIVEKIVEWAITLIVSVMVLNIAVSVFSRYVLNHSFAWGEELGRYLMIWAGFLGAALAMKADEHIGLTSIVDALPKALGRVIRILARCVVLAFLLIILVNSFKHLKSLSIQRSSAMEVPMVVPYFSVTMGVFLMAIEELLHIVKAFLNRPQTVPGK
jgi:TRAP-type C4-dicarboxylate transport system permease small subunit